MCFSQMGTPFGHPRADGAQGENVSIINPKIFKIRNLFLDNLVTYDETCYHFFEPECKQQSAVLTHSSAPSHSQTFKSAGKFMPIKHVSFDVRSIYRYQCLSDKSRNNIWLNIDLPCTCITKYHYNSSFFYSITTLLACWNMSQSMHSKIFVNFNITAYCKTRHTLDRKIHHTIDVTVFIF